MFSSRLAVDESPGAVWLYSCYIYCVTSFKTWIRTKDLDKIAVTVAVDWHLPSRKDGLVSAGMLLVFVSEVCG